MALIIDTSVIENQMKVLQAASTMDSELGKRLRDVIATEMKAVRDRIVGNIKFENGDPRGTAKAVRRVVYQKILGGNVNIMDRRAASGSTNSFEAPRIVYPGMKGHRGGNRNIRSKRTDDILHYGPLDRGWILRIVNSGTIPRYANGRNGRWGKRGGINRTFARLQEEGDYFRGSIGARNFFGMKGEPEMQKALGNLQEMIDQEFNKLFE
jgi:hypothetical protein